MPKETKPSLAVWVGGLLLAAALLAAAIAAYFYSHTAKSANSAGSSMYEVSDVDAVRKPGRQITRSARASPGSTL
jgi:hypothetical protein